VQYQGWGDFGQLCEVGLVVADESGENLPSDAEPVHVASRVSRSVPSCGGSLGQTMAEFPTPLRLEPRICKAFRVESRAGDQRGSQPSGWSTAQGGPPETHRRCDGAHWQGGPQPFAPLGERGSTGTSTDMPAGLEAGGPWRRIAGKVIDQVLLVAVVYGSAYLLGSMNVSSRAAWAAFWFACFWAMIFYNLVLVGLFATTVGKTVMGLRVVGPQGERAGWRVATRRWVLQLVYLVPVLGLLIGQGGAIVSLIYLFKDPRRQTVYDRVAGSFVVTTASMQRAQA